MNPLSLRLCKNQHKLNFTCSIFYLRIPGFLRQYLFHCPLFLRVLLPRPNTFIQNLLSYLSLMTHTYNYAYKVIHNVILNVMCLQDFNGFD